MLPFPLTESIAEYIESVVCYLINVFCELIFGGVLPSLFTSLLYFGKNFWSDSGGGKWGAKGWISTGGLNGIMKWEGDNLYGGLQNFVWWYDLGYYAEKRWCGVAGFKGIITKIGNEEEVFFLGLALKVKLGTGRP